MQRPLTIWTIGHSTRSMAEFGELLQDHRIELLGDVRRFPGSRRHPQFGQEQLSQALSKLDIGYAHFEALGGRRSARPESINTAWRNAAFRGYADYMMTQEFRHGVERLMELAREQLTVIMCAEALWWQCHRGLISDYLKVNGHEIIHIMGKGKIEQHPFTSAANVVKGKLSYAATTEQPELGISGGGPVRRR